MQRNMILSVRLFLDPETAMPPAKSVAGSVEQMLDTIGGWQEIGVSHVLFDPVASGGLDGRAAAGPGLGAARHLRRATACGDAAAAA